jgi:hypothetical protein
MPKSSSSSKRKTKRKPSPSDIEKTIKRGMSHWKKGKSIKQIFGEHDKYMKEHKPMVEGYMKVTRGMLKDTGKWSKKDIKGLETFFKENPHQFEDYRRDNAALFEPMRGTTKRGPRAHTTMKIQRIWRQKHGYKPPSPGDAGQKTKKRRRRRHKIRKHGRKH